MENPALIGTPPDRDNIKYSVESHGRMDILCEQLTTKLLLLRLDFPKTLIFCKTVAECTSMYKTLRRALDKDFTEPPGYPDYHQFRLVDMYTRASSEKMKEKVMRSFITAGSKLRILIATTAFSMGVDCPDIRNVIHYGSPANVEQYVQETGRAGRNGIFSSALLYGKPGKHIEQSMKDYCANSTECRRETLFKDFLFYKRNESIINTCKCCDVCELACKCDNC